MSEEQDWQELTQSERHEPIMGIAELVYVLEGRWYLALDGLQAHE